MTITYTYRSVNSCTLAVAITRLWAALFAFNRHRRPLVGQKNNNIDSVCFWGNNFVKKKLAMYRKLFRLIRYISIYLNSRFSRFFYAFFVVIALRRFDKCCEIKSPKKLNFVNIFFIFISLKNRMQVWQAAMWCRSSWRTYFAKASLRNRWYY